MIFSFTILRFTIDDWENVTIDYFFDLQFTIDRTLRWDAPIVNCKSNKS